ncbi:MAG: class I SAM-dependent methyltransferase [Planctomycetota bacterium]
MSDPRERVEKLVDAARVAGDEVGWFEPLYATAKSDADIPWADGKPNPMFVEWLDETAPLTGRALVIGCGLGDDAELLAQRGFDVTAFDISRSAIHRCRERFPDSPVQYEVADLLDPPRTYRGRNDLIVEIYTLQTLRGAMRFTAACNIADFARPGGLVFALCRGRDESEPEGTMPMPLTADDLAVFERRGLTRERFDDFFDGETPPKRRFRAVYRRPVAM